MKESRITISADDDEWTFWSKAVREVKKTTTAGLWAANPYTGARKLSKNNRYTQGAAKLANTGIKLLPIGGWNFFEIGEGTQKH